MALRFIQAAAIIRQGSTDSAGFGQHGAGIMTVGSVTNVRHHAVVTDGGWKFVSNNVNESRRDFLRKSAYVAPVILSMYAAPSLAGTGSPKKPHDDNNGKGHTTLRHQKHKHLSFFQAFRAAVRKAFT
ncbi:MAG: hypothetical protein IPK65_08970 [Gammaproteobacteria bacterium]|nr:hypothetical protein [Gammaproteobacteria bacterium]